MTYAHLSANVNMPMIWSTDNGLPLCRDPHVAYDGGWLEIAPNGLISVHEEWAPKSWSTWWVGLVSALDGDCLRFPDTLNGTLPEGMGT